MSFPSRARNCLAIVLLAVSSAAAEVPPLGVDQLRAQADLIVAAVVVLVEAHEETPRPDFVDTQYSITAEVKTVEKGEQALKGKTLVARGFRAKKRPTAWVGPSGHYAYPGGGRLGDLTKGSEVRLFLKSTEDGTYEILFPNGFAVLDEKRER